MATTIATNFGQRGFNAETSKAIEPTLPLGEIIDKAQFLSCKTQLRDATSKAFDFLELMKRNGPESARTMVERQFGSSPIREKFEPLCNNVMAISQEMTRTDALRQELASCGTHRMVAGKRFGYFAISPFEGDEHLIFYVTAVVSHGLIGAWIEDTGLVLQQDDAPWSVKIIPIMGCENHALLTGKFPPRESFGQIKHSALQPRSTNARAAKGIA